MHWKDDVLKSAFTVYIVKIYYALQYILII